MTFIKYSFFIVLFGVFFSGVFISDKYVFRKTFGEITDIKYIFVERSFDIDVVTFPSSW